MSFTAEQARGYSDMDPIYGEIKKRVEEKKRGDFYRDWETHNLKIGRAHV